MDANIPDDKLLIAHARWLQSRFHGQNPFRANSSEFFSTIDHFKTLV
jgi:hypothetical protein